MYVKILTTVTVNQPSNQQHSFCTDIYTLYSRHYILIQGLTVVITSGCLLSAAEVRLL